MISLLPSQRRLPLVSRFLRAGWGGLCLVVLAIAVAGAVPKAGPPRLESFELPDQFGKVHAFRFPRERPLLLVTGDRKGSEEIDPWIAPLKQRWSATADIHGIADVRSVPGFLEKRVTEAIRRSRPQPLMLDFDGKVTGRLPCESKAANIFVIGTDGRLKAHVYGPYRAGTNADPRLEDLAKALASPSPP